MVMVSYVDGGEDSFETKDPFPWIYCKEEQAFFIPCIEGDVMIPRESVKYLKHYRIKNEN